MAPRRRCPVCRSKQWHKEPSSGLIACSEGHILQNYRNESSEVDQVGPHALKKRTLKKQKKVRIASLDPKLYHGNRGRFFYFQCLQVILQHQVAFLMERWALPPEFEVICRDLWALHLSLLRNPLPAEPFLSQDSEEEDDSESHDAKEENNASSGLEAPKTPPSDEEATDEVKQHDPELDALLAENSASESSSSDGEEEIDVDGKKSMAPGKAKLNGRHKHERSVNTLAVIVLACWTLRVPILYRDLLRLIESYELPYLEAHRVLPPSMMAHLTKYNLQALSPPNTPSTLVLHKIVSSLARRIHSSFGILTPEANAAPILWRVVTHCLGGSPTLYKLTKRLAEILSLPLTLHHSLAPRLQRVKAQDPESHRYDNVAPELAFVATGIIVLKMLYGLDGKLRLPVDSEDPACDMPRIDEYLELLRRLEDADGDARDAEFDTQRAMAIEDLSDDTVDEYLAFCERALVVPTNADEMLERYFPVKGTQRSKIAVAAAPAEYPRSGLGATEPDGGAILQPGEEYLLGHSGDAYAIVAVRAAAWLGVGEESLDGVIAGYERRVRRWWQGVKRNEGTGLGSD